MDFAENSKVLQETHGQVSLSCAFHRSFGFRIRQNIVGANDSVWQQRDVGSSAIPAGENLSERAYRVRRRPENACSQCHRWPALNGNLPLQDLP